MIRRRSLGTAVLMIALFAVTSCGSSPEPRFHLLTAPAAPVQTDSTLKGLVVIEDVSIPDHLKRRGLVSRPATNALAVNRFDRWAEPLDRNVTAVLVNQLQARFPAAIVTDWRSRFATKPNWIVRVGVTGFELSADGSASLDAAWEVARGNGAVVSDQSLGSRRFRVASGGGTAAETVASLNILVANLGEAIGDTLASDKR